MCGPGGRTDVSVMKIRVLSEREKDRIVAEALRVLAEIGVDVAGDSLRQKLKKAGAKVDRSGRVKLPAEMAADTFMRMPRVQRRETIGGETLEIGGGHYSHVSLVLDPVIVDYDRGPREPCLADVARHTRIGDALPLVTGIYKMDQGVSDLPTGRADARTLAEFLCNTTKHVLSAPSSMESFRTWTEMLEIVLDGASIRERPIVTMGMHLKSPLRLMPLECELIESCTSMGIPIYGGACPMAGATSPFTLAGTVMQAVAETIFLGVAIQICEPGSAFLPGCSLFAFNAKHGTLTAGGCESTLMGIAYVEAIKGLGLPVAGCLGYADPAELDFQAGAEALAATLGMVLTEADQICGLGTIANAAGVSAEKIVMDHDLLEMADRFRIGIDIEDETLATDALAEVGPGGNFLESPHTLHYCRTTEHYYGGSFARGGHAAAGPGMREQAHARVEEILATHHPAVPDQTRELLQRYARDRGG